MTYSYFQNPNYHRLSHSKYMFALIFYEYILERIQMKSTDGNKEENSCSPLVRNHSIVYLSSKYSFSKYLCLDQAGWSFIGLQD